MYNVINTGSAMAYEWPAELNYTINHEVTMYVELLHQLTGSKLHIWTEFLTRSGLTADEDISQTVLIWDGETLAATGSRQANILKCIAVDPYHRGEDLTATVLTCLRQAAFEEGYRHLFLYTKPSNKYLFSSLFFYPVAQTDTVLLMENRKDGIRHFLDTLSAKDNQDATVGAIVMNCNPFTLGHRYLIETAAKESDKLYVFILSEDKSTFSTADRMEMAKLGTIDLPNVTILPTGPYLISSATFPTYFIKEREKSEHIHCLLDIEIFARHFVPYFGITTRFVGTEPLSPMTRQYNEALKLHLPRNGILLKELPRLEVHGVPVSASAVRAHIKAGDTDAIKTLVPPTTFEYLQAMPATRR